MSSDESLEGESDHRESDMGSMLVIWEGRVPPDRQSDLLEAYERSSQETPSAITHHALAQDLGDPEIWRIVSFWKSAEKLEEYRRAAGTPAGVLMFRAAGTEPTRAVSQVRAEGGI